jgi:rubrerythrin
MKSSLFLALALTTALLGACEQKPIRESNEAMSERSEAIIDSAHQHELRPAAGDTTAGKASSAVYECPMGCEGSRSSKPGQCPTCGMELEKKS